MPLAQVPPEILIEIIRRVAHLDHHTGTGRKPNLCSLSLCSSFFTQQLSHTSTAH